MKVVKNYVLQKGNNSGKIANSAIQTDISTLSTMKIYTNYENTAREGAVAMSSNIQSM